MNTLKNNLCIVQKVKSGLWCPTLPYFGVVQGKMQDPQKINKLNGLWEVQQRKDRADEGGTDSNGLEREWKDGRNGEGKYQVEAHFFLAETFHTQILNSQQCFSCDANIDFQTEHNVT